MKEQVEKAVLCRTEPRKGLEPGTGQRASHPHTVTTNNSEARMDKRMDVFLGSG